MEIRLQKYMAQCGIASRRKAEEMILAGLVKVNEVRITELGVKIDPEKDIVSYKGNRILQEEQKQYIMLNKPTGYITTMNDQFGRPSVAQLVKGQGRLYPVGRLDYDTSGLLLMTNDGDLTFRLTHPRHHVNKTYIAEVQGIPEEEKLNNFRRGLIIEGKKTAPAAIRIIKQADGRSTLEIIIHEGRNRQVRKMCAAIGHELLSLQRTAIGNLTIDGLKPGESRHLSDKEISYLKNLCRE